VFCSASRFLLCFLERDVLMTHDVVRSGGVKIFWFTYAGVPRLCLGLLGLLPCSLHFVCYLKLAC
jgi:hypothetical protein